MTPVHIQPPAIADIAEAAEHYEGQRLGLGVEFTLEVDAAIERAAEYPEMYDLKEQDARRVLVRRFPYSVYYVHEDDVIEMRQKMRDNLDKSTNDAFDLKQGEGGIADIEFLVQFVVLAHADAHPAVVHYSDNIRQLGTLAASGCLAEEESRRLQAIYKTYREFTHRLALDLQPAFAPADHFVDERRFVMALWQRTFADASEDVD